GEERGGVGGGGMFVGPRGCAAGAPAHVPRHRLACLQDPAQGDRLGHVHLPPFRSAPGTVPIDPAPMVSTTSPARASLRIASGISAIFSTNTGSTLPAPRIARASERPSAATIGASPAG